MRKKALCPIVDAVRQGGTADAQLRKARLEVLGGNLVKLEVLLRRPAPGPLLRAVVRVEVRLVPNLPIADVIAVAVCPALIVMPDDMLADRCPLVKIRRRQGVVLADLMLNPLPQAVKGLGPRLQRDRNVLIRAGEIVSPPTSASRLR